MSTSPAAAASSAAASRRSARSPAARRWRISPASTISLPGGRKVRLDELGTVTDAAAEPRTFARLDGQPVVAFAISRAKGASDADGGADASPSKVATICRPRIPTSSSRKIDNSVDLHRSATTNRPWRR